MSRVITAAELDAYTTKTLTPAVATQVVKAVNAYIERVTGRCWGDTASVTEEHDYERVVWLRHPDVVNVSSVKFGYYYGTDPMLEVESASYRWSKQGRLSFYHRLNYTGYPWRLEITYSYGVDEVPEDLKLAALGIAAGFYNWATGNQKEVSATQVGSYRVEYAGNRRAQDVIDTTAQANFAVLNSYKAPKV